MFVHSPARLRHVQTIASLTERIAEADQHGWQGEAESLRTSLAAANQKLTQMERTATNLGMPTVRSQSPRRPTAHPS